MDKEREQLSALVLMCELADLRAHVMVNPWMDDSGTRHHAVSQIVSAHHPNGMAMVVEGVDQEIWADAVREILAYSR